MTVGVTWYLHHSFKSANQSEAGQEKYSEGPICVSLQRHLLFFQRAPLQLIRRLHSWWAHRPALQVTPLDNVQSREAPVPIHNTTETPLQLHSSLSPSPSNKHSPTLKSAEIRSRRQGVLWLYSTLGLMITAFLEVPLSNVGHFVWISFCVNM